MKQEGGPPVLPDAQVAAPRPCGPGADSERRSTFVSNVWFG
jgi:hypothetical protein